MFADDEYPHSDKARAKAQRIGRPPSSKSAGMQARTWFDEVAAPRMQQMCTVQKEAVKAYDQALDKQVQQLTDALVQASTDPLWLPLLSWPSLNQAWTCRHGS